MRIPNPVNKVFMNKLLMSGAALVALAGAVQARSGKAVYHQHTSEMVTAARYEPRGSILKVTNPENGRSIVVRVNDRGPFNGNRILDLSTGAFRALYGGLGRGIAPVRYEVVSGGSSLNGSVFSSRHGSSRSVAKSSKKSKKYRSRHYRHRSRR